MGSRYVLPMNKTSLKIMRVQRRKKIFAVNFYGGKCIKCGYDKCINAMEFHHRDPSTKKARPSFIIMRWKWERVKEELDKCDLLCSNCHKEVEYKELDVTLQK
jgi:hypothetical protein